MGISLNFGRDSVAFGVGDAGCLGVRRGPKRLDDVAGAMLTALQSPHDYPALRMALTPDDRVCVVVDESIPQLGVLLAPVLEEITGRWR